MRITMRIVKLRLLLENKCESLVDSNEPLAILA
jgi:hypothetical protein